MTCRDAEAMRVAAEIRGGIEAWEERGRWAPLQHVRYTAGLESQPSRQGLPAHRAVCYTHA